MTRKKRKPVPLRILDDAQNFYRRFEHVQSETEKMAAAKQLAMLNGGNDITSMEKSFVKIQNALLWKNHGKIIYNFDRELARALAVQTDLSVTSETLKQLPFTCAYITLADVLTHPTSKVDGFFASRATDGSSVNLFFCNDRGDGLEMAVIELSDKKFDEKRELKAKKGTDPYSVKTQGGWSVCIQAMLYLCAQNADITENGTPVPEKRIKKHIPNTPNSKSEKQPLKQWDVGIRVGRTIKSARKKYTAPNSESDTGAVHGSRNRPRPHLRAAHWSHFWVGKGRTKKFCDG